MNIIKVLCLIAASIISACGLANGRYDMTSIEVPGPKESRSWKDVPAFKADVPTPPPPCIPIAKLYVDGNGYATEETLEEELREQAAEIGADYVMVGDLRITSDETLATYSRGLMLAGQIQRPHQAGLACRASKVSFGAHFDGNSFKIKYVYPNSAAAKAGFLEGEEILSADGTYLSGVDKYAWYRKVSVKQPGQTVVFEVLNKGGEKIKREVTLLAADPWPDALR